MRIANREELKEFRKKHPGWFFVVFLSSLVLVLICVGAWIYTGYSIGQMATAENAKNPLVAIPIVVGVIGAGSVAVGLDFILSSLFKSIVPEFPEDYLEKRRIVRLIGCGIIVCVICAIAMYLIAT